MTDAPDKGACCTVGRRPDVAGIDAQLKSGVKGALSAVALRTGISKASLSRHANECLNREGQDANRLGTASERDDVHPAARPVLEDARKLQRRASRLLRKLEEGDESVDFKAASGLLGAIHKALELQAKLLGEIKAASTTVNVYQTADWQAVKALLVEALTPFPEAALAVADVIEAQEQGAPSATQRKPSPLN